MRSLRTNLLNPISSQKTDLLPDHVITWDNGIITSVEPYNPALHRDCEDHRNAICSPGFIDIHVHLSQFRIRGNYRPALLPWLQEVVFPEEARSSDFSYARQLAQDFFSALLKAGTTTAVIYTAPFRKATEIAFEIAHRLGFRALIGMTLMDRNSPSDLLQSTAGAYETSLDLFDTWHGKSPLLDYIFTPRFAPTCSPELMRLIGDFASSRSAWIQTHLAENPDELRWVREIFGLESYTAVYEKFGLLGPHSILAHAIHLSDDEIRLLADSDSRIAHCPDSNFYLKSGEFPLSRLKAAGLKIALGSDVGAGSSLSMPHHAQMMNYRQSLEPVLPEEAFYNMTLGAARALDMDTVTGSLQPGKAADLILLKSPDHSPIDEHSLSRLVFYGSEYTVSETIIAGKSVKN